MFQFPASLLSRSFVPGLAIAVCIVGCGETPPAMVPVTGRVMQGDQPVSIGAIYFHPHVSNSFQDDTPSSQIGSDGQFTMKTFPFGEGVPPGRYKVTLGSEIATRLGHPELANLSRTPWSIEVTDAGVSDHVFAVEEK